MHTRKARATALAKPAPDGATADWPEPTGPAVLAVLKLEVNLSAMSNQTEGRPMCRPADSLLYYQEVLAGSDQVGRAQAASRKQHSITRRITAMEKLSYDSKCRHHLMDRTSRHYFITAGGLLTEAQSHMPCKSFDQLDQVTLVLTRCTSKSAHASL